MGFDESADRGHQQICGFLFQKLGSGGQTINVLAAYGGITARLLPVLVLKHIGFANRLDQAEGQSIYRALQVQRERAPGGIGRFKV
jgi:hypothetical protein